MQRISHDILRLWVWACVCGGAVVGITAGVVCAQTLPPIIDPTGRSGEPRPLERQEPLKPAPQPPQILPPVPPPSPADSLEKGPILRVFAKRILVAGSTVFSVRELAELTAPYQGREVSTEDLEELRRALTLLYINKGYPNSGVIIPDQAVTDGTITLQVIEGIVTEVHIEGRVWFRESYLKDRIELGTGAPFNLNPLRARLQLLLQDNRLERVNAELKPGAKLGEAVLGVTVKEASPWKAWVEFNNYQTPVVGAERGLATIAHQNVTGHGDVAMFTYGLSRGVNPIIDTSYLLPLNRYDTTIFFGYRRNDFLVVDKAFRPLDVQSQSEIFTITLRQPLYHTLADDVAVSLTGERLYNKTTLLGQDFDFVPGARNGTANVSALRFGQEWTHRTADSVFAVRSRLSVGVDVVGATVNSGAVADSQYLSWLGQAHWVKQFESTGIEVVNRMDLQVANDRMFPLEQFAVGGRFSVRGYRENTLIRDNAFLYSLEPRIPLWTSKEGYDLLQLAPFVDVGHAWNAKGPTPDPQTLASVGAGLRFNLFSHGFASVYWGHQLNHVSVPGATGNLQDHGVHVQVTINVL